MSRRVRPVRPESATAPSQRRSAHLRAVSGPRAKVAARAELLRQLDEGLARTQRRPPADSWAVRYLEASRGLKPPPPMSPAEQVKIAETQADLVVGVIRAMLDGIDITDEQHARAIEIRVKGLRAAAGQGWEPL